MYRSILLYYVYVQCINITILIYCLAIIHFGEFIKYNYISLVYIKYIILVIIIIIKI